jgi:DNA-binding transcriptional regulator YbjK
MSKALERRAKFREALILAAERSIAWGGLAALKTRELAQEIGL